MNDVVASVNQCGVSHDTAEKIWERRRERERETSGIVLHPPCVLPDGDDDPNDDDTTTKDAVLTFARAYVRMRDIPTPATETYK